MDFTPDILYEDNHLLVVIKPHNIAVQEDESKDDDLLNLLKNYIKVRDNKPGNVYLGLVHRLDRPTGGVMVFAKTSKAAKRLSESIKTPDFEKRYMAVCNGSMTGGATLKNYLKKNVRTNMVSVVPETSDGAKLAELTYKVIEAKEKVTLVDVVLATGRSHQIRVQLKHIGNPIYGDVRYGGDILAKGPNLALWAYKLRFVHPTTQKIMSFVAFPPEDKVPWSSFNLNNIKA